MQQANSTDFKIISYNPPLEQAYIVKREKRFFVEFTKKDQLSGQEQEHFWAHTNNTGSMTGLIRQNRPILLSAADNPKRKLAWTLEAICIDPTKLADASNITERKISKHSPWLGVNTQIPNKFLQALFYASQNDEQAYLLPFAKGYSHIRMEAQNQESRLDALITCQDNKQKPLWIECKNISLVEDETAAFPDAVSARALKHLESLIRIKNEGNRAAMLYVVQRTDASCFAPADYIDSAYAEGFKKAHGAGVEIYTVIANIQKDGIYFGGYIPLAKSCF